MLQLNYTRLLLMISFVLSVSVLTSCDKNDDDAASGQVQLLSFGPTGAAHGDTLRFIGLNLSKVSSIQFTGTNAVVDQKDFKQQSSDLILVVVPTSAEKGFVTLKTADGDITTKTVLNLNVKTAASIASVTKQARPGENVTITGNYLNWVNRITFNRDKVVTEFVSQSQNQLVVKVPVDAQTGPLLVSFSGTDTIDVETADTVQVALPTATSFAPNPVKHGDNVTINGTDLDLTTKVYFTGVSNAVTSFVSQTATQLVVKVPASTTKGTVTLEAASGVKKVSSTELNLMLPAITALPTDPVDPGSNITITGTNLDLVDSITFQNAAAVKTFVSQTATQIVAKVPTGVTEGKVTLHVKNSTLTVQSANALLIAGAVPPPTIAFPIYNDAVTSNWTSTGWIGNGWGGTKDLNNTNPVREGDKSVRINYVGSWGSPLQLGGASINISAYSTFKVSIYGAPGSAGKKVSIAINGTDKQTITVVEGKWTDYAFPLSTLTSSTTLSEILIKEFSDTGGFTIYVDALGLN